MKDLLLVVPSRGRPQNIHRLWETMQATCRGETYLVVGLDEDDATRDQYPQGPMYEVRSGLHQVVAWINALAPPRAGHFRYIGMIGDDNLPQTEGWDVRVMEALEETPFAFGNDLYPYGTPIHCANHVFTRGETIEALGYFGPPGIIHMYVDVAWTAWGTATGITYLPDVIIEHLHYSLGKAASDDLYRHTTGLIPSDLQRWHAYGRSGQLNADIRKLGGREFSAEELRIFNRDLNIPEGQFGER